LALQVAVCHCFTIFHLETFEVGKLSSEIETSFYGFCKGHRKGMEKGGIQKAQSTDKAEELLSKRSHILTPNVLELSGPSLTNLKKNRWDIFRILTLYSSHLLCI